MTRSASGPGQHWRSDWFVGILVLLAVLLLNGVTDFFGTLERRYYDFSITSTVRQPSDRIAIIAIDDASIANIGRWPWPRDVHARLIDQLAASMRRAGNVLIPSVFTLGVPLGRTFEGQALDEARQRFLREAETAGRLQHPNIVTIFDAGEDHELAYIAMEFLSGKDLTQATTAGHLLPVPSVLSIVARVADALAYAHQQGVNHRDIKPANIMYDPDSDRVKVTDFGIARITDSSKTRTGLTLGTPSFMCAWKASAYDAFGTVAATQTRAPATTPQAPRPAHGTDSPQ